MWTVAVVADDVDYFGVDYLDSGFVHFFGVFVLPGALIVLISVPVVAELVISIDRFVVPIHVVFPVNNCLDC